MLDKLTEVKRYQSPWIRSRRQFDLGRGDALQAIITLSFPPFSGSEWWEEPPEESLAARILSPGFIVDTAYMNSEETTLFLVQTVSITLSRSWEGYKRRGVGRDKSKLWSWGCGAVCGIRAIFPWSFVDGGRYMSMGCMCVLGEYLTRSWYIHWTLEYRNLFFRLLVNGSRFIQGWLPLWNIKKKMKIEEVWDKMVFSEKTWEYFFCQNP